MPKEVIKKWEEATEEVANAFVEKYFPEHGREDYFWVGDEIGSVFCIADMFFDVDRMLEALKLNATFDQLYDYYDEELEHCEGDPNKPMPVSFKNYVKHGLLTPIT